MFIDLLMPEAPGATIAIMLICMTISFANSTINRLLISRFVGWKQYKINQKEISEYRKLSTQAMRAKDTDTLERLKKQQSKIMSMQKKMAKPQLVLYGLSFSYILIWWFVIMPTYSTNTVAYIPGIGPVSVFYWYFICSMWFGIISSRLLGIMTIE